ncbi:MAG: VOC family protein [Pseudomonadales bacterium]
MADLAEIVFDSARPAELARFWAAALTGYAVRPYDAAEIERLAALGFTPESDPTVAVDGPGPTLFFQRSEQPKTQRNRVHLDLSTPDRVDEVARLAELGAHVRDEHDSFTVMLDPEGNEFCVRDLHAA